MPLNPRPQITFNPHNPEHAAWVRRSLETNKDGIAKLDPQFRFLLEEGFSSVLAMAVHKMAEAWMVQMEAEAPKFRDPAAKTDNNVVSFTHGTSLRGRSVPTTVPVQA